MTRQTPGEGADDRITRAFRRLRDDVRAGTPPFNRILNAPRRRPAPFGRLLAAAAALILVAGTTLWWAMRERYPILPEAYDVIQWEAPSDFLLDSRSRELLATVPELGRPNIPRYRPNGNGPPRL